MPSELPKRTPPSVKRPGTMVWLTEEEKAEVVECAESMQLNETMIGKAALLAFVRAAKAKGYVIKWPPQIDFK